MKRKKLLSLLCALSIMTTLPFAVPVVLGAEGTEVEPKAIQSVFSGSIWNTYEWRDLSEVYFDTLGANLITDPTVANFKNGEYPEYYDSVTKDTTVPANAKAWWDKPASSYHGFTSENIVALYTSMSRSGYVCDDPTLSHTADGSGVLKVTRTGASAQFLPLPVFEANSYYAITFWVKSTLAAADDWDASSMKLELSPHGTALQDLNYTRIRQLNGNWMQFAFVVYTGDKSYYEPAIEIPGSANKATYYFDDFGMFKLDDVYGSACMEAGYMLPTPTDGFSADPTSLCLNAGAYNESYEKIDWSDYGKNICPDSTVARFTDGVYSSYYATSGNYDITDRLAQWDVPIDKYHAQINNSATFFSPSDRGFVTADTAYSHAADGSGAIYIPARENTAGETVAQSAYLALPSLEKYSYYAIALWVKSPEREWGEIMLHSSNFERFAGNAEFGSNFSVDSDNDCWQRVTFLVYTGAKAFSVPNLEVKIKNGSADEIEVWKLEDEAFAESCISEKRLVIKGDIDNSLALASNDLAALRKELIIDNVKSTVISDVNGNGFVDICDLVKLKKLISNIL